MLGFWHRNTLPSNSAIRKHSQFTEEQVPWLVSVPDFFLLLTYLKTPVVPLNWSHLQRWKNALSAFTHPPFTHTNKLLQSRCVKIIEKKDMVLTTAVLFCSSLAFCLCVQKLEGIYLDQLIYNWAKVTQTLEALFKTEIPTDPSLTPVNSLVIWGTFQLAQ